MSAAPPSRPGARRQKLRSALDVAVAESACTLSCMSPLPFFAFAFPSRPLRSSPLLTPLSSPIFALLLISRSVHWRQGHSQASASTSLQAPLPAAALPARPAQARSPALTRRRRRGALPATWTRARRCTCPRSSSRVDDARALAASCCRLLPPAPLQLQLSSVSAHRCARARARACACAGGGLILSRLMPMDQ